MSDINDPAKASREHGFSLLVKLHTEALGFTARDKIERLAQKWLADLPIGQNPALARVFACELTFITPSMLGTTAFDRLARAMKGRPLAELSAVSLLRRGQLTLARLSGAQFEDLATRTTRTLLPSPFSQNVKPGEVFGRFTLTPDGFMMAAGPLVTLDAAALALIRPFIRPGGRGLENPLRCAEAVYRHYVANAEPWPAPSQPPPKPQLPFDPERRPLDALAAHWASLPSDPGPGEIARAQAFADERHLLNALTAVGIARRGDAARLSAAYRRIAAVLMETLAAREQYGSGHVRLDDIAARLDAAYPAEVKTLFLELRARVRVASNPAKVAGSDLERLIGRIRALREKTVEQGCTEAEALAAAEKVADLLDRYGLSLSELDLRNQACEGIGVETGRKRRGAIDGCMTTIAAFFDCRVWSETDVRGLLRYVFFGMPGDVQAAVYLHDLIAAAFVSETWSFQTGPVYNASPPAHRRTATTSFQFGMARGIVGKLETLRRSREASNARAPGKALVPVKQSIIETELGLLGLHLTRASGSRRRVMPEAYEQGKAAGARFEYRPGIER